MLIRLALASLAAAALLAAPVIAAAAVATAATTPIPKPVAPDVLRLPLASPSPAAVTGPPQNPAGPTLWIKPAGHAQMILSNINESLSDNGKGCLTFTITAPLNANDAVTLLQYFNQNLVFLEANVYAGPVVYRLVNAVMRSYSASPASARFTLTEQKSTIVAGSQSTSGECGAT